MKLLVSSLEASANLHFEQILPHLGEVELKGIFGERFSEFGVPLYESGKFSAMGFVEVLPLILKAKRAIKQMCEVAKECDAVLLIDSPAFNLPLAKALKKAGVTTPVTYYILPQVWAWRASRAKVVDEVCDNAVCIFPFETKFFKKAQFLGHPLLDEISAKFGSNSVLTGEQTRRQVAFLPGSRKGEISRLMPVFRELLPKFKEFKCTLVIPPHLRGSEVYGDVSGFELSYNTHETLSKSHFAFVCSGTATLEAALIGTPFVLCYKANAIDIFLARKLVKLKHAGLANIIFDFLGNKPLHEELIGGEVSAQRLFEAYEKCDFKAFAKSREVLREYLVGGSAKNVAKILKG